MNAELPIDRALPRIVEALDEHGSLVLSATPGSGKTTRVPPALLDASGGGRSDEIWVLEPRRIAARAAARRVASERGEGVGQSVGYIVRHDRKRSDATRIVFVTEGILLRRLLADPELPGIGTVVLDEVHERHVETDLCLAMLRDVREHLRPELSIALMSATVQAESFAKYLDAPHVDVAGSLFEVETRWDERRDDAPLAERVRRACAESLDAQDALGAQEQGVLVFLPGVREIEDAARALERVAKQRDAAILPLHGRLKPGEQDAAIRRQAQRKIVLATNVAESSLTVDGVRAVVDSGLARVARRDARTGFDQLRLEAISRASADQRRGRAARTGPGFCRRLWTQGEERSRPAHTDAELLRVALAGPQLSVRAFAGRGVEDFPWFEKPDARELEEADRLLGRIGAIDAEGTMTRIGERMLRFPLPPRLARLMLASEEHDCAFEAAALTTLLQIPKRGDDKLGRLGLLGGVEALARGERGLLDPAQRRGMRELVRDAAPHAELPDEALTACMLAAYPDRVCRRSDEDPDFANLASGGRVRVPRSLPRETRFFLALDLRRIGESELRVTESVALDLAQLDAELMTIREEGRLMPKEGRVRLIERTRYMRLTLEERSMGDAPAETATPLLAELLAKDVGRWIGKQDSLRALQARAAWLRAQSDEEALATPDGGMPSWSDAALVPWLLTLVSHAGSGARGLPSLARLDLGALLRARDAAASARLEREAPRSVKLPTGREAPIDYAAPAGPTVAARVQELFGCNGLPRLAGGATHLLIEILGPNYRPVQLTADLAGFWERTYPLVRGELRRRYPKHAWPEDPKSAKAESRPRRPKRG